MSKGTELIAAERQRQIDEEGWTPEHDAQWHNNELLNAAACYIYSDDWSFVEDHWPWMYEWWKPRDRKRNLVRAGALIAAEIDRLLQEKSDDPA